MLSKQNKDKLTFEDEIQNLIDKMHSEAQAAQNIYNSRGDKESTIMPLAFGEAFGFSNGVQKYADELQTLLIRSGPKGEAAFNKSTEDQKVKLSEKDYFLVYIPMDRNVPQERFTEDIKKKYPEVKNLQPVYMLKDIVEHVDKFAGLIIVEGHASKNLLTNLEDRGVDVKSIKVIEYSDYSVISAKL